MEGDRVRVNMITSLLWPQPIVYWHSRLKFYFFKSHLQVNFCCNAGCSEQWRWNDLRVDGDVAEAYVLLGCVQGCSDPGRWRCYVLSKRRVSIINWRCVISQSNGILKTEETCLYSHVWRLDILYFSLLVPSGRQNIFFKADIPLCCSNSVIPKTIQSNATTFIIKTVMFLHSVATCFDQ